MSIEERFIISKNYMIASAIVKTFPFFTMEDLNIFLENNRIHIVCEKEKIHFSLPYNAEIRDFTEEFMKEFKEKN